MTTSALSLVRAPGTTDLERLRAASDLEYLARCLVTALTIKSRSDGYSLRSIGKQLGGISEQAAWNRIDRSTRNPAHYLASGELRQRYGPASSHGLADQTPIGPP